MRTGVKKQNNLFLLIAAFLALAIMLSLWLITGMLAKYTAQDDAGGSAQVALFNVSADTSFTATELSIDQSSTDKASFDIEMTNSSEVAVQPEVVLTFAEAFTESEQGCFKFSLEDNTSSSYAWSDDGTSVTISGLSIMAAADKGTASEQSCTVIINGLSLYSSTAFENVSLNTDTDNDGVSDSGSAEFSLDVDVNFTQVD